MVSFLFRQKLENKIFDLYDIVNNISLFHQNGIHIDNIDLHRNEYREYDIDHGTEKDYMEYMINVLNLTYKNLLDPHIFYSTLQNFNKYKPIIGYYISSRYLNEKFLLAEFRFKKYDLSCYAVSSSRPYSLNQSLEIFK